ncbi:MAG TPA: replicative DNA helicase [Candidatus Latescibacteria bacterium]|nr:replicative DNA helicase [Candidatus Latescibacterota bacterium]
MADQGNRVQASRVYERVPPQADDIERAVLGAMLIDRQAVSKVIEILDESCFYRNAHRKIYQAIIALFERDEPADQITVAEELRKRGQLEDVGGVLFLATLVRDIPTAANVEYHARIVLDKALLRRLITLSSQIATECYEEAGDVFELIDRAEQMIFSLSERRLKRGFLPLESILHETFEAIEKSHHKPGGVIGVPTGFTKLDELTAGLQASDLIVVAGRPSMGKTAFGLNIARNAAVETKVPVGIFSLEMAGHQVAQRLLCAEARVDSHLVRTGRLPDHAWSRLSIAVGGLAEAPIFVDDTPALSILELRAKARRLQAEHNVGLIIIDYLQLMTGPTRAESRQQEISIISRSLKALAKELNVPVLAISQLSRAVEARGGDHRPQLFDLRESGAIEQDADVVLFIYRPERYGITEDAQGNSLKGVAEIIIGKQRHGPTGTVHLTWLDQYARFENPAFEREEPA